MKEEEWVGEEREAEESVAVVVLAVLGMQSPRCPSARLLLSLSPVHRGEWSLPGRIAFSYLFRCISALS